MIVGVLYIAGFAIALFRADAPVGQRLVMALLWPLGPLAFLFTVSALTAAAMIVFPIFGALVVAAGALGWFFR
jgi:hypothetical protein